MTLMSQRSWDEWIAEYAQNHTHQANRFCHTIGIPMIALSVLFFVAGFFVRSLLLVAGVLFVVGWVFQLVGHAFEGKPPEFLKEPKTKAAAKKQVEAFSERAFLFEVGAGIPEFAGGDVRLSIAVEVGDGAAFVVVHVQLLHAEFQAGGICAIERHLAVPSGLVVSRRQTRR